MHILLLAAFAFSPALADDLLSADPDWDEDEDDDLFDVSPSETLGEGPDGEAPDTAPADPLGEDPDWDTPLPDAASTESLGEDPDWDIDEPLLDEPPIRSTTPALDEDPDWDIDGPDDLDDLRPAQSEDPPAPRAGLGPPVGDRAPLADNYPLQIVGTDMGAVVVELPVLIAKQSSDINGSYWLIANIKVDGQPVGESRQHISPTSASALGPSFVWFKSMVPAVETPGTIEIAVSIQPEGNDPVTLFTRSTELGL